MLSIILLVIPYIFLILKLNKKYNILISFIFLTYIFFIAVIKNFTIFSTLSLLLCVLLIPLIIYNFKLREKEKIEKINRKKELTKETAEKLELKIKDLKNINSGLSSRVNEISNLYEVTKQMSKALEFQEVFKIFTSIIKENFHFKSCKFIILSKLKTPSKIYSIEKEEIRIDGKDIRIVNLEETDQKIIKKLKDIRTPFYISKDKKDPDNIDIDFQVNEKSLVAIPLISEKEIIAILLISDLLYREYYNLLIFAGQFSLQMKKVKLYERIHELAIKDDLTGVFVRRYFLERSREEFKRAVKYELTYSFLMLDIDHFKQHNDKYGHLVGDRLLKEIADIITDSVREVDLVGRFGGEEFSIVLPDTDIQGSKLVAERIREQIQNYEFKVYDERIHITTSIGVCNFPKHTSFFDSLINNADMALYRAKKEGRNKTCVYDVSKDKVPYHKG